MYLQMSGFLGTPLKGHVFAFDGGNVKMQSALLFILLSSKCGCFCRGNENGIGYSSEYSRKSNNPENILKIIFVCQQNEK